MSEQRVIEHRESAAAQWMRDRRLRLALLIAFVESLVVLFSEHGWWYVVAAAVVACAAHWFVGRRKGGVLHEITWTAAVSQLLAMFVPILWEVVKILAIVVLLILGGFLLVTLLLDRK
ncbi:MAG TPA: hypothetical protein VFW80_09925 [Gaiellaceae bacterium]|nr:hypothetical protein [Gaiellaceae bacterium]